MQSTIERLLRSPEPSIRYRVQVGVLDSDPSSAQVVALREEIRQCPRSQALLGEQGADGKIPVRGYQKWRGVHWVLACLADCSYPPGDERLNPLRDQECAWLFSTKHQKHIQSIAGRTRRCASQEGNALRAMLLLGLGGEHTDELARRLVTWQWSDGGWNCDKRPQASHSSFWESLIPMRALALHARITGNAASGKAAQHAAEFFLAHRLFRRIRDGEVIQPEFLQLSYPWFWRYNLLAGLIGIAEAGCIQDPRCEEALDWLESRRLPDGGFPADTKYYRVSQVETSGTSRVGWGPTGTKKMNEFVTAEALVVLRAANRIDLQ